MISAIRGGNTPFKKAPKPPVAPGAYGAQVISIQEVEQEQKFGENVGKIEKVLKILCAITDGDHTDVPQYEFQQDPDDPNYYGRFITVWMAPSLSNGERGNQSNLHKLWVAANKGRTDAEGKSIDGKPMTQGEINRISANPALIEELVGKRLKIVVDINPNTGNNKVTNYLAATAKVKAYVEPTFRLTPEQLADKTELVYVDTGKPVTGWHRLKADGTWEYINAQSAADSSIKNYGDIYSPAEQARRREAGLRLSQATGQVRKASEDTDDVPF